jgi:hypothetical protein
MRLLTHLLLVATTLYGLAWTARIYARKYDVWLPGYVKWRIAEQETAPGLKHILFLYSDHFEPAGHFHRTQRWAEEYPMLANVHRDSNGRPLQHTWFFPGDDLRDESLAALQGLAAAGYGEVELHLHHLNDTEESAEQKFRDAIAYFQKFGFLRTVDGQTRFGFAHGNGGLDNSRGAALCGVNRELDLLRRLGCYADFSFPAVWQESQPAVVNAILAATDDPGPKSYNRAPRVAVHQPLEGRLVIFQGPVQLYACFCPGQLFVRVEDADIHASVPVTPERVDRWVRANIHVQGRPDWIFIKVHGHGAGSDAEVEENLGANFDRALSYLERKYNDGVRYALHYVTAREAYNVVRAANEGRIGNPRQYYNWVVKPYLANEVKAVSGAMRDRQDAAAE